MQTPQVSVVVPCLNEEGFIGDLLMSLNEQKQLLSSFEVVIVDNGSTDGTLDEVWRAASDIKFSIRLVHELHRGVSRARNTGAAAATSNLLVFLDADNRVPPTFVHSILHIINNRNVGAATIATLAGEPSLIGHFVFFTLEIIKRIVRRPFGKSVVHKSLWYEIGGFDNEIVCGENVEFLLRVKALCQKRGLLFAHVRDPIVCSLRRFAYDGYAAVLLPWLRAYLGEWQMPYKAVCEMKPEHTSLSVTHGLQ
jgi:glycosyltransferase involved in cell wall biosynthesis